MSFQWDWNSSNSEPKVPSPPVPSSDDPNDSELISQDEELPSLTFETNSQLKKDFEIIETIGEGAFGTVIKVKNKIDDCFYAIKYIALNKIDNQSNTKKEVQLLSPLIHNNIVRYYRAWIDNAIVDDARDYIVFKDGNSSPPKSPPRKRSMDVLCIQMQYCERTLAESIDDNLYTDNFRVWRMFWEIVEGLAYLKENDVIHRDLKPENIFLDGKDRIKIGDFGLATKMFSGSSIDERILQFLSPGVGTFLYRAPELDLVPEGSKANYGQEIDMYSLGIILFEMFNPPFTTQNERCKVLSDLRNVGIIMPSAFLNDENNAEQINLLRSLLNHDASARPTCTDLLRVHKNKQLINSDIFQEHLEKEKNRITLQYLQLFLNKRLTLQSDDDVCI